MPWKPGRPMTAIGRPQPAARAGNTSSLPVMPGSGRGESSETNAAAWPGPLWLVGRGDAVVVETEGPPTMPMA
jgi:hypothetical protein